jgi:hypothetical protein
MSRPAVQCFGTPQIRRSELLGALSHALDVVEGQPAGHCVRSCWIGIHIGREIGLDEEKIWELYYTLLLKDLGCSSNAARICRLFLTDDLAFKHDVKTVDGSLPEALRFVLSHTALKAGLTDRFRTLIKCLPEQWQDRPGADGNPVIVVPTSPARCTFPKPSRLASRISMNIGTAAACR